MEIMNDIIGKWLSYASFLERELSKVKAEHDEHLINLEELEDSIESLKFDEDNEADLFYDVYYFMDSIGVDRKELPFTPKGPDYAQYQIINTEKTEIEKEDSLALKRIRMFQRYLDIIAAIKGSGVDVLSIRKDAERCISDFEFCIDIYLFYCNSKRLLNESEYEEYQHLAYEKVIEQFTIDNMKRYGHPSSDEALDNGYAEFVLLICKVSCEYHYLCKLAEKMKDPKSNKGIIAMTMRKEKKGNSLFDAWNRDIALVEQTILKDSIFYKAYANNITASKKKEIDLFIKNIRKGWF